MKLILFYCLFFLVNVNAHKVWTWLQGNNKILWNRYNIDSVEQQCVTLTQPTNNAAMCAKGSLGWKCMTLYENNDCSGQSHEDHVNYLGSLCSDSFDTNMANGFDIKYTINFYARSIKTYNC